MSKFLLTQPLVEKEKIDRTENGYPGLPSYLQSLVNPFDHIWKVTITPQITRQDDAGTLGPCRVVISASYENRTGNLFIDNQGRKPSITPPAGLDDLRPIVYYVWGNGTQVFNVIYTRFTSNRVSTTISFD